MHLSTTIAQLYIPNYETSNDAHSCGSFFFLGIKEMIDEAHSWVREDMTRHEENE